MAEKLIMRLRCTHVTDYGHSREVHLRPVYEDEGPNKSFAEATPDGDLRLSITNETAFGFYEPGRGYDFVCSPCEG